MRWRMAGEADGAKKFGRQTRIQVHLLYVLFAIVLLVSQFVYHSSTYTQKQHTSHRVPTSSACVLFALDAPRVLRLFSTLFNLFNRFFPIFHSLTWWCHYFPFNFWIFISFLFFCLEMRSPIFSRFIFISLWTGIIFLSFPWWYFTRFSLFLFHFLSTSLPFSRYLPQNFPKISLVIPELSQFSVQVSSNCPFTSMDLVPISHFILSAVHPQIEFLSFSLSLYLHLPRPQRFHSIHRVCARPFHPLYNNNLLCALVVVGYVIVHLTPIPPIPKLKPDHCVYAVYYLRPSKLRRKKKQQKFALFVLAPLRCHFSAIFRSDGCALYPSRFHLLALARWMCFCLFVYCSDYCYWYIYWSSSQASFAA